MKKYLIIKGASLALIIGGIIASCAKDDVEYVPISVKKTQEYEKVFREVFGEISPNQNWGFSTEVPEEAVEEVEEQASTRTVNCTHTFPSAPSSSAYKSSVPSGVTYLGSFGGDVYNRVQSNTAYWVDGNTLIVSSKEASKELAFSQQKIKTFDVKYENAGRIAEFLNKNTLF